MSFAGITRRIAVRLFAAVLLVGPPLDTPAPDRALNWPVFNYDPARSG